VFVYVDSAAASVSSETMQLLDRLMVEGDLLPVDVEQQHSLHIVLAACDSDSYNIKLIKFEVCFVLCEHHCLAIPPSTTTTTIVLWPFVLDYPGEPVPEETFAHPPS